MKFLAAGLTVLMLLCGTSQVLADTQTVQLFGGAAYNFRLPTVIRQEGADNVRFNADYDTKPFESPMYYSARLAWWRDNSAWELELVHHKLTLVNNPSEVEYFSITHGFNLLTVNRAWKKQYFIWRLGAGVVITHPESTVRGRTFDQNGGIVDGYFISGPTAQIAIEKRFYLYKGLFASIEGKYTLSWAHVPIADGSADVWNSA
ncbi:MAG: hypothetical protein Q8912_07250, partial [Bacillota bacterium]|nr:hypothetical protein [Bacillota bacterium]